MVYLKTVKQEFLWKCGKTSECLHPIKILERVGYCLFLMKTNTQLSVEKTSALFYRILSFRGNTWNHVTSECLHPIKILERVGYCLFLMKTNTQLSVEKTSALFYRILSFRGNTWNHVTLMRISKPMWKKN